MRPVWISLILAAALAGAYAAAGGASYSPEGVADPCEPREWREPDSLDALAQQLALSGMDGAACELGVTRESLARALASDAARESFMDRNGIDEAELESAVRAGLERIIDDAEEAGEIGSLTAIGLRSAVRVIPARQAFELLLDARPLLEGGLGVVEGVGSLDLGSVLEGLGGDRR